MVGAVCSTPENLCTVAKGISSIFMINTDGEILLYFCGIGCSLASSC